MTTMDTIKIPSSLTRMACRLRLILSTRARAMDQVTVKLTRISCAKKSLVQAARMKATRATRDVAHVLRIMIFLHSAKDFSSVLRLYGMENPSGAKPKTVERRQICPPG